MEQLKLPFDTINTLKDEIDNIHSEIQQLDSLERALKKQIRAACTHPKDKRYKKLEHLPGDLNGYYVTYCTICRKKLNKPIGA